MPFPLGSRGLLMVRLAFKKQLQHPDVEKKNVRTKKSIPVHRKSKCRRRLDFFSTATSEVNPAASTCKLQTAVTECASSVHAAPNQVDESLSGANAAIPPVEGLPPGFHEAAAPVVGPGAIAAISPVEGLPPGSHGAASQVVGPGAKAAIPPVEGLPPGFQEAAAPVEGPGAYAAAPSVDGLAPGAHAAAPPVAGSTPRAHATVPPVDSVEHASFEVDSDGDITMANIQASPIHAAPNEVDESLTGANAAIPVVEGLPPGSHEAAAPVVGPGAIAAIPPVEALPPGSHEAAPPVVGPGAIAAISPVEGFPSSVDSVEQASFEVDSDGDITMGNLQDNLELSESTDKAIFDMFQILESAEAQSAASELGNAPAVTGDGQGDITSSRSDEFTQLVNNCDGHPATADIEDQNTLTAAARHDGKEAGMQEGGSVGRPNGQKGKRCRTENEKNKLNRMKHPLRPPCQCKDKCGDKFTFSERESVWNMFWNLSFDRRRDWIVSNVNKIPKQRVTNTNKKSRRSNTIVWSMGSKKVCKSFFLNTLGYSNDKVVVAALKNASVAVLSTDSELVVGAHGDGRGHHKPANKFSEDFSKQVVDHIESYRPQISHYKREHAPHRRYLPSDLSVRDMHRHFIDKKKVENGRTCSYGYYLQIFTSMNISFTQPSNDLCHTCLVHDNSHPKAEDHTCSTCNCDTCLNYPEHKLRASQARHAMEADTSRMQTDDNLLVTTVDLQKAITMPKVPTKEHFFSRKVVVFNETFACPQKNGPVLCVVWHEAEAGRKAFNITSAFLSFIRHNRDKGEIIMFCDNCSSQNKCWPLFSALVRIVNDPSLGTQCITLKYLEKGHTFMQADSVHGSIGKKMNSHESIYDFKDFVEVIKSSRKAMECLTLDHKSMYQFENESKKMKGFLLSEVRVASFRRGSVCLYCKKSHDQVEFKEVNFLRKTSEREIVTLLQQKQSPVDVIPCMPTPRGISQAKKTEVLKLAAVMPPHKRTFFEGLNVNDDVPDLEVED